MSSSIGVNTSGPAQTLLTQMQTAIDSGNTMKKALSTATQQIPAGWSGPAAQNWLADAENHITSLANFIAETVSAHLTAKSTMSNISVAGGGSEV